MRIFEHFLVVAEIFSRMELIEERRTGNFLIERMSEIMYNMLVYCL